MFIRSCTVPGGTAKEIDCGPCGSALAAVPSGTLPRNNGWPLGRIAINATRVAVEGGVPGVGGAGSHEKVSWVFPSGVRAVPIHVRIWRPFGADVVASAFSYSGGGGAAVIVAVARFTSSAVYAQYPLRARICRPLRFTRTLISWNFPSFGAR